MTERNDRAIFVSGFSDALQGNIPNIEERDVRSDIGTKIGARHESGRAAYAGQSVKHGVSGRADDPFDAGKVCEFENRGHQFPEQDVNSRRRPRP